MKTPFVKMHGAGNDFVMIDDREETFPLEDHKFIARIANRPDGVGCEGVIFVRKSDKADFAMRFFNPDGSEAELCGNGARAVAAFAYSIGAARARTMRFETLAGMISAVVHDNETVTIGMPQPKDLRKDFVNSGVPHAIVAVENIDAANVAEEGRKIRYSEAFAPAGTNVDFVAYAPPHELKIRTYERGVEAETFACGTGSVAAAVIGVDQYGLKFPVSVKTSRGDTLVIDGSCTGDGRYERVTLTGPVKTVFSGVFE